MTAYIDNNILVDIEQNKLSRNDFVRNLNIEIKSFYYSVLHLFEADQITGTGNEREECLKVRFNTITDLTENKYLNYELESHTMLIENYEPEKLFRNLEKTDAKHTIKEIANSITKVERDAVKIAFEVSPLHLNNFTPDEVIFELNQKRDLFKGLSVIEILNVAKEQNFPGKQFELYEDIASTMEILDLVGYWKDKYSSKSNYARAMDGMHVFYSTHCDYFISDDVRTRNKAKVIFKLLNINTNIVSSSGN